MKDLDSIEEIKKGTKFRFKGGNDVYEVQERLQYVCMANLLQQDQVLGLPNVWFFPMSLFNKYHIELVE